MVVGDPELLEPRHLLRRARNELGDLFRRQSGHGATLASEVPDSFQEPADGAPKLA
jgi:hypothetical protein